MEATKTPDPLPRYDAKRWPIEAAKIVDCEPLDPEHYRLTLSLPDGNTQHRHVTLEWVRRAQSRGSGMLVGGYYIRGETPSGAWVEDWQDAASFEAGFDLLGGTLLASTVPDAVARLHESAETMAKACEELAASEPALEYQAAAAALRTARRYLFAKLAALQGAVQPGAPAVPAMPAAQVPS